MLHVEVKIKICGKEQVFGPGIAQLLTNVRKSGSVKEACGRMGMSYSKGWKIVNRAEKELGIRLIERQHGGKSGGSCQVTEQGLKMLDRVESMEKELEGTAAEMFRTYFPEYEAERRAEAETL